MCRFLAWIGAPRFLYDFVLEPDQSLVTQSRSALIGKTSLNADGFGLAWYGEREMPCVYRDVHPAWSDENLRQLAYHTKARLFLAHVRASTSTATSRNNCHPFSRGRWSFMHNGQLGGHLKLRQRLDALIPTGCYDQRYGATDSEAIFLIAAGSGLDDDPVQAMAQAVKQAEMLSRDAGSTPHMRFSACWSNGKNVYAARYATDQFVPSLFYRIHDDGILICSEPLEEDLGEWIEVPPGTAIITDGQRIENQEFRP